MRAWRTALVAALGCLLGCSIVLDPEDLIGEGPSDGGPAMDGANEDAPFDAAPVEPDGAIARLRLIPGWVRPVSGPGVDLVRECGFDALGNVTLAGRFEEGASLEGELLANAGGIDGLVARYDPEGSLLMQRTLGGAQSDTLEGLRILGDTTILTGRFNGSVDFGGGVRSATLFDTLVLALDTETLAWKWDTTGTGDRPGWGLAIDARDAQVYVTGLFVGNHTFDGCAPVAGDGESEHLFVARLDGTTGRCEWQQGFSTEGQDRGQAVAIERASDGFVAVAGRLAGMPLGAPTGFQPFLGAFNRGNGDALEAVGIPFVPMDIVADDSRGWCVVGQRDGGGSPVVFEDGSEFTTMNADGFITCRRGGGRLDVPHWSASLGGAGASGLRSVGYDAGRLVVVGNFNGEAQLDEGPQVAEGPADGLLAVFDVETGRRDLATVSASGDGDVQLYDVAVAGDQVCVAGEFSGELRVGSRTLSSTNESTDGFLAVYSLSEL